MNLYLLLDIVVVIALLILAMVVLLKNTRVALNRYFASFAFCISVWIMANYISNDLHNSTRVATLANNFVFSFSFGAAVFMLGFVINLTGDPKAAKIQRKSYAAMALVTAICFTPLAVKSVHVQGSLYAVEFGPLAYLYFLSLLLLLTSVLYVLGKNIRKSKGDQRARLKVLFRSTLASLTLVMLTQSVLPVATGWFGLTNIGILPMLIMVFGLYYSVVKHRLFDIRLIIARSVGYLLSTASITVIFGVITFFVLNNLVLKQENVSVRQGVIFSFLAVLIAYTFPPLKRFFDRITNRIFYRDAYDPQAFLDQLNKNLVTNIQLEPLLNNTINIIQSHIKSEFCIFWLKETEYSPMRIIGSANNTVDKTNVEKIPAKVHLTESKILVTDELANEGYTELQSILQKNDVALLARLTPTVGDEEGIGYLLLGPKKSGNPFSKADAGIIEIIVNELVIAIQNSLRFEEIEKFNITLQEKIEDATHRLQRTNEKLKALDETKDEFISMASHQLRTPLTSVKGYLSMVLEGDAGPLDEMQHKLLDQAFVSSQRMVYLIADLLNVSRLKTGKFVIEPVPSNLADVVEGEVNQLVDTAKGRNLTLSYKKPEHFPTLMLDETKIRQVIMNFTDNAIYYTPSGGHITLHLVDKPNTIEFTVVDDGMGVPKEEQHHLFTKFYRAGNAKKARPDGTGLGLFMAQKVIVAQGGSIIFRSQVGKGSTFGFSFAKSKLKVPETTQTPNPVAVSKVPTSEKQPAAVS